MEFEIVLRGASRIGTLVMTSIAILDWLGTDGDDGDDGNGREFVPMDEFRKRQIRK